MEFNKNILIIGLGTTGISAINALKGNGNTLYVYDDNKDQIGEAPSGTQWFEGQDLDYIVKSPGIPLNNQFVSQVAKNHPIYSDIELAYRLTQCENIVAITGTNGKTTMTRLLEEVILKGGKKVYVGGNIGVGILPLALKAKKDDIMVIECSSFQLETIEAFKPKIAILSNITEDHLDHHLDLESYRDSKKNIYKNQDDSDCLILNIDDPYLAQVGEEEEQAYVVSLLPIQQKGAYLADNSLYYNLDGQVKKFMDRKDLLIVGDHNVRNLLEVLLASLLLGIDEEAIKESFKEFKGVEHRIEYLGKYKGASIYNDSKGTNPDSTHVALNSMPGPVHLLMGGYDKGVSFEGLLEKNKDIIKGLYVYGETGPIIKKEATSLGIESLNMYSNLEEALNSALENIVEGEVLLLSPACASWDQFKNYEERGELFKKIIKDKMRS